MEQESQNELDHVLRCLLSLAYVLVHGLRHRAFLYDQVGEENLDVVVKQAPCKGKVQVLHQHMEVELVVVDVTDVLLLRRHSHSNLDVSVVELGRRQDAYLDSLDRDIHLGEDCRRLVVHDIIKVVELVQLLGQQHILHLLV